jgi:mannan endo-1,4-beta-mannosidase
VALTTSFLFSYASAAIIPDGALQALEAGAKPMLKRGVSASPLGRVFEIDGKVQHFAATNAWWLGHLTNDADLHTAMSEIAQVHTTLNLLASCYRH